MENKVYLVTDNCDYEGGYVSSVHRSEEGAIKAAEKLAKSQRVPFPRTGKYEWRRHSESILVEDIELED